MLLDSPEHIPETLSTLLSSTLAGLWKHRGIRGGGERDRTDDPLLAKQVLSQLSYTPDKPLVGLVGLEPTTPALSRRCSNQLSYRPVAFFVNR